MTSANKPVPFVQSNDAQEHDKCNQQIKSSVDRRGNNRRKKTNLLQEAEGLVYGERNLDYGHPSTNFSNIADLWNAYLSAKHTNQQGVGPYLNNIDIAALNILQKIARISTNQKHMDSWKDIAGYAATAERIIKNF